LSPQQRRYQDAAKAFAAFIDKYPGDPLTPNAKYWLGEAYYVSQQNAPALAAFEQVVADHPGDTKAPGALYKIGRLKEAAGDRTAARAAYQRVLKDYPGAPAAGLSRQRLQKLGG
jgi:tol-pal system protein YbgF